VGTHKSLDDSMRVTGGGGTIVLVGNAAVLPPLDMTFVWAKELKIEGTVFYGNENWRGKRARTFEVCLDLLTTTQAPVGALLTHTFPLGHYRQAIDVNLDRRQSKSVKAVFDLRAS
jgi:threonine dehydrogenase-like Zn-dependent dehydrogenase